jgi:hypothetical protein
LLGHVPQTENVFALLEGWSRWVSGALPPDQVQKLGTQGGILAKTAEKARGDRVAVSFFNAAHLQAHMPCFHHNSDTARKQNAINRFCDLAGQPLPEAGGGGRTRRPI